MPGEQPAKTAILVLMTQVHGHRGARAVLPENTLPAFEYAIATGVDALELDVLVTRDDVVVVAHDPVLSRRICDIPGRKRRRIRNLTLNELRRYDFGSLQNRRFPRQQPVYGTRVPTLDDVFDLAPLGKFEFNIEVKSFPGKPLLAPPPERFARLLLDAIERHRLQSRVLVQSFDFRVLRALDRLAPELRLSALYASGLRSFAAVARQAGTHCVSPYYRLVTKRRVSAAHAAGIRVLCWTANRPRQWRRLLRAGVDAIITDDPAELVAYLKAQ